MHCSRLLTYRIPLLGFDHRPPGPAVRLPVEGGVGRGSTVYSIGGSHFFSQGCQVEEDTRNTLAIRYIAGFSISRL